ncbi:MAG: insulinase family protein [Anaerolineaceae bacterium]|nr:insulinase family protein [Anaerolineaceae bacterium]
MNLLHGFEALRAQDIPEINSHARIYRHRRTGAQLISLENDDSNKVFGITFTTPPPDSTGLPHILEHTVLCGSRKYPVKDPFIQLARGSLNTFLNAMTYPDKTTYPVASQNLQDFYNLVDVYLDAVFYPRISPRVLAQEGWRHEPDDDGNLVFQGVVFNEMKGAWSSPDSLLGRESEQALFPDTVYGHDSGGDPRQIPDLTWEQFRQFHETCYHPGNARIWFYGDDDPQQRLRLIDDFIRDFGPQSLSPQIPLQQRWTEPRSIRVGYAVTGDDAQQKGLMTLNWMLDEFSDAELTLGLGILDIILLGTPASPLRVALIESGLGEDVTGGTGGHLRQMTFSAGMKGIAVADADRVERLILDTLETLATTGIEAEMIEAAVNTVEFRLRENNTGGFPRGLALMLRAMTSWLHDRDPLAPLAFEAPLAALKGRIAHGEPWFEALIRKWLLENPHRATVLLEPDPAAEEKRLADEQARLEAARSAMSGQELEALREEAEALRRAQETPDTPEALASIPLLRLEDLEPRSRVIPIEEERLHDVPLLTHDLFTNGIVYLDLALNLRALPRELLPWVPLFSAALLEMGTRHEDYLRLSKRIGRKTGGIRAGTLLSSVVGSEECSAWLMLRAKGTLAQAQDMLDILRDVLLDATFEDPERFLQLALEEKAGAESGLIPGGHAVVNSRLGAHFTEAGWVGEQMGGVSNLLFLRERIRHSEEGNAEAGAVLEDIRRRLVNRKCMIANVTLDAKGLDAFRPQLGALLETLPAAPSQRQRWGREAMPAREGLSLPAQVNYVGKGARLTDHGYSWHGSAMVARGWLNTSWLWEKLRVQGGAYGGFAVHDRLSGVFNFLSYRDPQLLRTLDACDGATAALAQYRPGRDEVTRAIIGAIGSLDSYQLPDAQGYSSLMRHLVGLTDDMRQENREQVLATTGADLRRFADALAAVRDQGDIVVLGSAAALEAAGQERADLPGRVTKVL